MEMHQVRYFLAVAETLNFTRAAEKVNVAQPSLTRAIIKLEDELGGPLFNRERNNTHLTELGQLMLPHLRQTFEAAQAARLHAQGFHKRERGLLTLGLDRDAAPPGLAAILKAQTEAIPGLELRLVSADTAGLIEALTAGQTEAAVMVRSADFPERFVSTPMGSDHLAVAFPAEHPFADRAEVPVTALDSLALILPDRAAGAEAKLARLGVVPGTTHAVEDTGWLAGLIAEGVGVAVLPTAVAARLGLAHRPLIDDTGSRLLRETVFVTMAGRRHSPALDALQRAITTADWGA